jgi:hypothetical protein
MRTLAKCIAWDGATICNVTLSQVWVRLGMSKLVSSVSVAPCFHIAQTTGISLVLPSEECCILIYNLLAEIPGVARDSR